MSEKPKKKIGKIILRILGVLLAVIIVICIVVAVIASKNVKSMNAAVDEALAAISEKYTVTEEDCGEYSQMTVYGIMKFKVKQYDVEEVGNLSVMTVNVGAMQMASVILNPQEKNLPLVSADYMYMLNNRKCFLELYNLVEEMDDDYKALLERFDGLEDKYSSLEDSSSSPAWFDDLRTSTRYKAGKPSDDALLSEMLGDGFKAVLENSESLPELTEEQKNAKNEITKKYTEGLITQGGISTDAFKASLGEEITRDFFSKVLFGTGKMD